MRIIKDRCNGCTECCKFMAFPFPDKPKKGFYDFYNKRGCQVKYIDGIAWVIVPFACPKLTENGCGDYENRPDGCKVFDGRTHPISKGYCKIERD